MNKNFDFIVVGGGSAGAVLASRLTENKDCTVLLLEAGGNDNSLSIQIPVGAASIVPRAHKNWAFETVPQPGLNNRKGYQPRGKVLGGSSSINAMVYVRGHQQDYDDWGSLGWGWKDVLPYFLKSEHNESIHDELHGQGGLLNVADSRSNNLVADAFIEAAKNAGFPYSSDFNGKRQEGIGRYQVTQKNGERCSAAKGYLSHSVRERDNLTIITNAHTTKLLVKELHCYGVEAEIKGKRYQFYASKEVELAAGAFGSPQLLMLSGIGNTEELDALGIKSLHHLPGVGENLQDHPDYVSAYLADTHQVFGLSLKGGGYMAKEAIKFLGKKEGMFTSNFAETGGFLKTSPELERPDIQFHFTIALVKDHARDMKASLSHGFSNHVCVLRPKSKGTLKLASADPMAAPLIDPNFLSAPEDVDVMLKGIRLSCQIMQQPEIRQYIKKPIDNESKMNDQELVQHIRDMSDTVYHPVGTCKMGTDKMAVVTPELKVHGLTGLRVVDASIFPNLIGGNTNAPTIMVAERASDWIKQEYLAK